MQLEEWEIFIEIRLLSLGTACFRVYSFQYISSTITIFHFLETTTPVVTRFILMYLKVHPSCSCNITLNIYWSAVQV